MRYVPGLITVAALGVALSSACYPQPPADPTPGGFVVSLVHGAAQ